VVHGADRVVARRLGIRALQILAATILVVVTARFVCVASSRIEPPSGVKIPDEKVVVDGSMARYAGNTLRRRGAIWELSIAGEPAVRGASVSKLLRVPMIDDEHELYAAFSKAVPFAPARWAIVDLGRFRYRHVDQGIPPVYRDEIAGLSLGFSPDPFEGLLPSYHRFVFLYAVYDIALSFEKSPLIGCTTFTVPPVASDGAVDPEIAKSQKDPAWNTKGHAFLARAFDFEAGDTFDRDKVVFLVREPGRIPFASVGWPGFVGVVSGMNREGVALVVHGGRAGTPRAEGMPVVFSLRETLATAHDTEEAIRILSAHPVMVSHIVIVQDAKGNTAVVERAPGFAAHVRRSFARLATTNHFEGPLSQDPHDAEVRRVTSTLPRRMRGDAILAAMPERPSVFDMVGALRDRIGVDGKPLPLGDRRAIDALIATHGVVMDTSARQLWVSESPHLLGRFVRFPLDVLLADDFDPAKDPSASGGEGFAAVPADPMLVDGRYDLFKLEAKR